MYTLQATVLHSYLVSWNELHAHTFNASSQKWWRHTDTQTHSVYIQKANCIKSTYANPLIHWIVTLVCDRQQNPVLIKWESLATTT